MKDTHTVLTELKERMEVERRSIKHAGGPSGYCKRCGNMNSECECIGYNTAITRCISLVEEKLKANSK